MTIREAIRLIAEQGDERMILATVSDVNDNDRTCTCTPINGDAEILEVRLQTTVSVGVYLKPAEGSLVLVCMANETLGFVVLTSELEEVIYFDGSLGGLIKINELVSKVNTIENKINQIISTFNTHVHSGVTTGAGSSAITPTTISGTLTNTVVADLENGKIKHGV